MNLLDRYDSNKKIWEIYSGKEVKILAHEVNKEINKMSREIETWRLKLHDDMKLSEKQRAEAEIRRRDSHKQEMIIIFNNINNQVKDWFKP